MINNQQIFIIGLRRSGTSILRKLVLKIPQVKSIDFEPHELMLACEVIGIPRYRNVKYLRDAINCYKNQNKTVGAKIALNIGIKAMEWQNLPYYFPNAKFVFIVRNPIKTFTSWKRVETSRRGVCNYHNLYLPWYEHITLSFTEFQNIVPENAVILHYEDLIENTDFEVNKVCKLLKVEGLRNLSQYIKKPKTR